MSGEVSEVNGWTLFAHPLFLAQVEELIGQVEGLKKKAPESYKRKNATKRLAAINQLVFNIIPLDPTLPVYRQGDTLGDEYKHWFRAIFYPQYRLFFRFHQQSKIIIYAWVNDEDTKRAYKSKTDAYRVFQKMLDSGNPPDTWDELFKQGKASSKRLKKVKYW